MVPELKKGPGAFSDLEESRNMLTDSLKYVCKCLGIVIVAVAGSVLVGAVVVLKMYPSLTGLGRFGILSALVIDIIGIPVLIAAFVVGLIGGKLVGGWRWNGFLLSGIYYLCYLAFYPWTGANPKLVVMMVFAWPLAIIAGGLMYSRMVHQKEVNK
jgi:hypothetical protein